MDGVSSATRRSRDFDESTSTSELVNEAKKNAGIKEAPLLIRGDDKTLDEILHERHGMSLAEAASGAVHGFEVAHAAFGHMVEVKGLALGLEAVALPVAAWTLGQYAMYEMQKKKDDTKNAAARDQMHAAVVRFVDIPESSRQEALAHLNVSTTAQSPNQKILNAIVGDAKMQSILQHHCDEGMNAARSTFDARRDPADALKTDVALKARYDADVAFKTGFDAMVRAKKSDPHAYDEALGKLDARNPRNQQSVQVRG